MIPLCVPNVGEQERANLNRCIDENFVSSVGPFVRELESRLAEIAGCGEAVSTGSGTQALHLAFHVAGVRPGDLVVMPAFTFIATANAARQAGAELALVDVEKDGWTMDAEALRAFLEEDCTSDGQGATHRASGRRVAAIAPVYTLGNVARMREITEIARATETPVIADAAAALGSTYEGAPLGELAELSTFSFNGNKIITTGCGGAVVGRRSDWLARARRLASTARRGAEYDHDEAAFNYRMSNMDAGVGCAQLGKLDAFVEAKRRIRAAYEAVITRHDHAAGFPEPPWTRSNCWFSGVVLQPEAPDREVQALAERLRRQKVEARTFWKPLHLQEPYAGSLRGPLQLTERLWSKILTLPCSTGLTEAELGHCTQALDDGLSALAGARLAAG